ncbi:MAG: bifunctional hydroxymethylpyrimidine kinase/phosphomethylpyrimidine kinase [Verrucomicrobiota bacterium]
MRTPNLKQTPVAMTVAGSDSGGMAGMQADLLTFAANGVYGVTAMTCVTAQNPEGIAKLEVLDADFVSEQAKALNRYFAIQAAKTGLLCNREIIDQVADFFISNPSIQLVVDPVMVSSSGARIISEEAIDALKSKLLPLAKIITPNLDEAEILIDSPLKDPDALERAAKEMASKWNATVYLKGGHLGGERLYDISCSPEGESRSYSQKSIQSIDTHGSGCTLSSCITAHLAKGEGSLASIEHARDYLRKGMERPVFHRNAPFINHFPS